MTAAEHSALIREACEWLACHGYFAWPNRTGSAVIDGRRIPFGKKGSADILCVLPGGIHGEFEGKTGNAVQKKPQKAHQRQVEKRGGVYFVFHSVAELKDEIAKRGYPT